MAKKSKKIYEMYINDKLYKKCTASEIDGLFDKIKTEQFKDYNCISSCYGGGYGHYVLFDEKSYKTACVHYDCFTGYKDTKGQRIFCKNSTLVDEYGTNYSFFHHYAKDDNVYILRAFHSNGREIIISSQDDLDRYHLKIREA